MLDRILAPLDGSRTADRILQQVRRLLRGKDAKVTLLHVRTAAEDACAHMEDLGRSLASEGVRCDTRIVDGDPGTRILEVADEIDPSIIAMSSHGRSGIRRFVRGSVAERVLAHARHPLLLASPFVTERPEELPIRRILVPLDGSELSTAVLPVAAEIAQLYGAEILLFHALEVTSLDFPSIAVALTLEDADALLRSGADRIAGVPVRLRAARGMAAKTIIEAAAEERADIIALATHGHSGLSRWAYGSVAEKVLRHAPCPVIAVRTSHVPAAPADLPPTLGRHGLHPVIGRG
jgi:nucleotide-binding universal stress UspA family protein